MARWVAKSCVCIRNRRVVGLGGNRVIPAGKSAYGRDYSVAGASRLPERPQFRNPISDTQFQKQQLMKNRLTKALFSLIPLFCCEFQSAQRR